MADKKKQAVQTDYNKKFAISQTAIKDWEDMSPKKWQETWVLKTRPRPQAGASASFGSLLDCLVFTPKTFDKRFVVAEIELPSDSICTVVGGVYNRLKELNANATKMNELNPGNKIPMKEIKLDHQDLIQSIAKDANYFAKQPVRAYNEVIKNGQEYFDFIKKLDGKQAVSQTDMEMAKKLCDILYTDKMVKGFFNPSKGSEVVFQQQIYADLEVSGFDNIDFLPLKGQLDDILFNHKKKTVREIDLKWTNDAFLFEESVKRFGYIKQHSFYDHLLREWLKTYRDGEFKDYTVANPLNVVIDSDECVPYIYQYNGNDLNIERHGHENMHWFKGWEQILYEIAWHMDTQQWDRPREHYLNGFMNLSKYKR